MLAATPAAGHPTNARPTAAPSVLRNSPDLPSSPPRDCAALRRARWLAVQRSLQRRRDRVRCWLADPPVLALADEVRGRPARLEAITGSPAAIASRVTIPNVSASVGNTTGRVSHRGPERSSWATNPRNLTRSPRSNDRARPSRLARSGPEPATVRCRSERSSKARARKVGTRPFRGIRLCHEQKPYRCASAEMAVRPLGDVKGIWGEEICGPRNAQRREAVNCAVLAATAPLAARVKTDSARSLSGPRSAASDAGVPSLHRIRGVPRTQQYKRRINGWHGVPTNYHYIGVERAQEPKQLEADIKWFRPPSSRQRVRL